MHPPKKPGDRVPLQDLNLTLRGLCKSPKQLTLLHQYQAVFKPQSKSKQLRAVCQLETAESKDGPKGGLTVGLLGPRAAMHLVQLSSQGFPPYSPERGSGHRCHVRSYSSTRVSGPMNQLMDFCGYSLGYELVEVGEIFRVAADIEVRIHQTHRVRRGGYGEWATVGDRGDAAAVAAPESGGAGERVAAAECRRVESEVAWDSRRSWLVELRGVCDDRAKLDALEKRVVALSLKFAKYVKFYCNVEGF